MSLTCISCKVAFSLSTLHQEHYKSDWHRYNLKRRIAELPPLTKEEYEKRAEAFKADATAEKDREASSCDACGKHFASKNALANHLKSKKHLETAAFSKKAATQPPAKKATDDVEMADDNDEEWSEDGDWESCSDDDGEDRQRIVVDTNNCLFCDHPSETAEDNVSHMSSAHSFFVPDIECVSDLDGFIAVLAAKIFLGRLCLWCDGKGRGFRSVKSVRQHMVDKGHCKVLFDGEAALAYADFYDFPSSENSEELDEILENADYELVLPSGATVGHRSLSLYYKQNLKPVSSDNLQKVRKVIQQYKSLGYTGTTGKLAVRQAKDIAFVKRMKDRYNLKMSLKMNKFQPHFRQQVMF